jgi:hypothetical protein
MSKTVPFKMPTPKLGGADAWIEQGVEPHLKPAAEMIAAPSESMKRLTIDVTQSLHIRIKTQCARNGWKIADKVRELLEAAFAENRENAKS